MVCVSVSLHYIQKPPFMWQLKRLRLSFARKSIFWAKLLVQYVLCNKDLYKRFYDGAEKCKQYLIIRTLLLLANQFLIQFN